MQGKWLQFNECIDASVIERMHRVEGYAPINVKRALERGIKIADSVKEIIVPVNQQNAVSIP